MVRAVILDDASKDMRSEDRTDLDIAPKPVSAHRSVLSDWTRALAATADLGQGPNVSLAALVTEVAGKTPAAPALLSDSESMTYGDLVEFMDRVAVWACRTNLGPGVTVALLMENRPTFVALWLGLTRIGISAALLNTNLRGDALAHCLHAAAPQAVIVSAAHLPAWNSAAASFANAIPLWVWERDAGDKHSLQAALASASEVTPAPAYTPATSDRALLIYTSGTTGLPKAANVSHGRVLSWALWFAGMLDTRPSDRMYNCLPLYHSVGGVVAVGALLARGGSVVIAPAFSASRFFEDVRRWECTLAQYIGELCRYLLATPVQPAEQMHGLRAICGNGLREDVWRAFEARFNIPRIIEFYAASEGTFSLYNMEGEPGAIGRVPNFLRHRFPAAIVRLDAETGDPTRDADGRCSRVAVNESGEALGRIAMRGNSVFEGYTDPVATERKILRDVFAPGDAWMRTGDLMRIDAQGFWFFVDRLGDTFRWKGENVSTLEVAEAVRAAAGVQDACVYGVIVPGADGRAGMAALSISSGFDVTAFALHIAERLPSYAVPIFLRLTDTLELTGTMKHQTRNFADVGFEPGSTSDRVLVYRKSQRTYEEMTPAMRIALNAGDFAL